MCFGFFIVGGLLLILFVILYGVLILFDLSNIFIVLIGGLYYNILY